MAEYTIAILNKSSKFYKSGSTMAGVTYQDKFKKCYYKVLTAPNRQFKISGSKVPNATMKIVPSKCKISPGAPYALESYNGLPGTISGHTKIMNSIAPFKIVFLIYRKTGALVDRQVSDSSGYFQFKNLITGSSSYLVLSVDSSYNAVVFDRVVPA